MAVNIKIKIILLLLRLERKMEMSKTTPQAFRDYTLKTFRRIKSLTNYPPEKMWSVTEELVPVSKGESIQLTIYKPDNSGNHPLLMFFHGGGFVIGNVEMYDLACRRLAKQNNSVIVFVSYRLAPEYPYPTAVEDCYAATEWAVQHASMLGADPNQLAVVGDSAGGNLATVVSMICRDKGGPKIKCQILIYPWINLTLSLDSIERLGENYWLTKELLAWFGNHYCGNEKDLTKYDLSPLFATDLKDLPPALIVVGEYDPLIDEGKAYAKRLGDAGNQVIFTEYKGMTHVFFVLPKYVKAARDLELQISTTLSKHLRPGNISAH